MNDRFPLLLALFWAAVLSTGFAFLVHGAQGCRSTVPVVVNAQHYQCNIEHQGGNGTIEFRDCIKTDGTGPVQKNASDSSGDDETSGLHTRKNWRLN